MPDFMTSALLNAITQRLQGVGTSYVDEQDRQKQLAEQIRIWRLQQGIPVVEQPEMATEERTSIPIQQEPTNTGVIDLRNTPAPVNTSIPPQLVSLIKSIQRPASEEEIVMGMQGKTPGFKIIPKEKELTPGQKATEKHREWQRGFAERKESLAIPPDIKTALSQANAYLAQARSLPEGDPQRTLFQTQGRSYLEEVNRLSKEKYKSKVPENVLVELQISDPEWYESIFGKTGKENVIVEAGSGRDKAIKYLQDNGALQTEANIRATMDNFGWK